MDSKNYHLNPQFITNEHGEKTAVILSLQQYEELLEDLKDLAVAAERRNESTVTHEQVLRELRKDGYL